MVEGIQTKKIHETAIIDPSATIGEGVEIGAYSIIGPEVTIGDRTKIGPHVMIAGYTTIGKDCRFFQFCSIGEEPQDLKFAGEKSYVEIGDRTVVRECVTIHRATGEGEVTRIGNDCLLMATVHIAHNCVIGDHVIMSNTVGLAGHVCVEPRVVIGGMTGVHQFVKIGRNAMIGGLSRLNQDVVPYTIVNGIPAKAIGLNSVGLIRAGISKEARQKIKQAYKILYRSSYTVSQAIEHIQNEIETCEEIEFFLNFLRSADRGICRARAEHDKNDE